MLAIIWITLGLPGIYGVAAALAINMAIAYGLTYLGGKLFGQSPKEAEDEPRGQSFAWDPHTTFQEGIPRPMCYGRNLHYGNLVMRWTDVDPISGNEILFKALDYGEGPVQGVMGGVVSDSNHCLGGTPEFTILLNQYIDTWYQTAGNVNDDNKTTYVGFTGTEGYGHPLKGRFESIVTFESTTVNRIEYRRYWYISGNTLHQGYEKVYLWYGGEYHLVSTKNITTEGSDVGTIKAGGSWEDVTKIKIVVELSAIEFWFRTWRNYATITYRLYELRAWHLEDVPVFLNGQPAHNFTEVDVQVRLGTLNQTCMKGFEKNKLQYAPETTIVHGESVRWTTPNKFGDDIEFTLAWLRGLYYYASDGDLKTHRVGVKVEISERAAEDWSTVLDTLVSARQLKQLYKAYSVNTLVPGTVVHGTQYDLRFSKTTEDKSPGRHGDEMQLRSVREVVDVAFTHPGRALLGVIVEATERLQGRVDVTWTTDDKLVHVYNGETEAWEVKYSRNRAWIDLAIHIQPIISGDGSEEHPWVVERYEGLSPSRVDLTKWYEWAQWCDAQVPSGVGEETEKRMPCDIICDRLTNVWSIAYEIAQIGRMYPYWQGVTLTGWIDKVTTESIDLITMDNTMAGSWKSSYAGYGEMAGSVEVFYKDAQQGYARKSRPVHNKNSGLYTRVVALEGVGVTNEALATRVGNHALKRNELIKNINSVRMGREALRYRLGRVVMVQCNVPGWGQAFRVVTSPTSSTVELDRVVEDVSVGDLLWVKTFDTVNNEVSLDSYTVQSVAGKVVTITTTWAAGRTPLKDHMAAIGIDGDIVPRRIIKMEHAVDNYFDVTLETYDEKLFDSDGADPELTNPDYVCPVTEIAAPMTRQTVVDIINALAAPTPKIIKPQLFNCKWVGDDVDTVEWAKRNPDEPILLVWEGETYEITPGDTTLEFIYWDSETPTVFCKTADAAVALATGMYLACTNKDGVEQPIDMLQMTHGAIIQLGTIIAEQIIIGGINALGLMNAPAESGADVTGGHQADIQLANVSGYLAKEQLSAKSLANLLDNPDFELGDQSWTKDAGWSIIEDATNAYVGDYVLKYLYPGSGSGNKYTYQRIKVSEGEIYEIAGYAKNGAGSAKDLKITLNFRDKDNGIVNYTHSSSPVIDGTTYTRTSMVKTVPATAIIMETNLSVFDVGAGAVAYFDMVTVHQFHKADDVAETGAKKWAGETGADVTAGKQAGSIANQGDLATIDEVGTGQIANLAVETEKVKDNAITLPVSCYNPDNFYVGAEKTIAEVSITTFGKPVALWFSCIPKITETDNYYIRVYRGVTKIYDSGAFYNTGVDVNFAAVIKDTPDVGSYTYYLKAKGHINVRNRSLIAMEIKK